MADFMKSRWRISHSGLILLDWSDRLVAEPDLGWLKNVQVEPLQEGGEPFIADRGNVQNTISFERIKTHASFEAAREWRMSHSIQLAELGRGETLIEIQDGAAFVLKRSVVGSGSSSSGVDLGLDPSRSAMSVEIIGGAFALQLNPQLGVYVQPGDSDYYYLQP